MAVRVDADGPVAHGGEVSWASDWNAMNEEVVAKAKVIAARRGTSMNGLLAQELTRLADADEAFERAKAAALARLQTGARLGARGMPSREEM